MNQLERYSLFSALKIGDFFSEESYFPVVSENYIVIHNSENKDGESYSDWAEVLSILYSFLNQNKIDIVVIGKPLALDGIKTINLTDLNLHQNFYISKRSLLYCGLSGYISHLLHQQNVPLVTLFSKDKSRFFCGLDKPNHFRIESKSTLNKINPNLIAEAVSKKIKLNFVNPFEEEFFSGHLSNVKTLEVVPDFIPDQSFFPRSTINIRADLHFDEQNIFNFCQGRACGIITSSDFSDNFLRSVSPKNIRFSIDLNENISDRFISSLKNLGFSFDLFTHDQDNLYKLRLKYIDSKIEYYPLKTKKDLDNSIDICNNTCFKSSKTMYSKNKEFSSKAHWIVGQEKSHDYESVLDTKDFWNDLDFMHIYNKKNER